MIVHGNSDLLFSIKATIAKPHWMITRQRQARVDHEPIVVASSKSLEKVSGFTRGNR
jgi:hypothetical protein